MISVVPELVAPDSYLAQHFFVNKAFPVHLVTYFCIVCDSVFHNKSFSVLSVTASFTIRVSDCDRPDIYMNSLWNSPVNFVSATNII